MEKKGLQFFDAKQFQILMQQKQLWWEGKIFQVV